MKAPVLTRICGKRGKKSFYVDDVQSSRHCHPAYNLEVLSPDRRGRVTVVLVRARNPQNIGAVARAMHDFGFGDLRIVNPYEVPLEAARSAVDASEVVRGASSFASVAEAVADCTLVLGTTAVGERRLEHPLEPLAEAAERAASELARVWADGEHPRAGSGLDPEVGEPRMALLFGSEKTGLSNEELSHCHALVTIPMQLHEGMRHPSMNLGQAVAVCLYELVRGTPMPPRGPAGDPASAGVTERVRELLAEVLDEAEYGSHHPANTTEADLRRLVLRMRLTRVDAPVWMGMLRQIAWKLRHPAGRG